MEEQFDNWVNKDVSYPIILIKYEKIFDYLDVLFDFLGLDKNYIKEFPKKRENRSESIKLNKNLQKSFEGIYSKLCSKIESMPDYLIRN